MPTKSWAPHSKKALGGEWSRPFRSRPQVVSSKGSKYVMWWMERVLLEDHAVFFFWAHLPKNNSLCYKCPIPASHFMHNEHLCARSPLPHVYLFPHSTHNPGLTISYLALLYTMHDFILDKVCQRYVAPAVVRFYICQVPPPSHIPGSYI